MLNVVRQLLHLPFAVCKAAANEKVLDLAGAPVTNGGEDIYRLIIRPDNIFFVIRIDSISAAAAVEQKCGSFFFCIVYKITSDPAFNARLNPINHL